MSNVFKCSRCGKFTSTGTVIFRGEAFCATCATCDHEWSVGARDQECSKCDARKVYVPRLGWVRVK